MSNNIEDFFPFPSYRKYQKEVLKKAKESLVEDTDVVIIEAPTGFGKSPVNIALGKYFNPTFYTTPQKKLVTQLSNDFGAEKLAIDGGVNDVMSLLGRDNYICRKSGKPSNQCPIYNNKDLKCSGEEKCTYWRQKEETQSSDVAIITFAMLIINNYLSGKAHFDSRELLIVDECHSLEGQVASMFAGFTISPYSFPEGYRMEIWNKIYPKFPKTERIEDYIPILEHTNDVCKNYRPLLEKEIQKNKMDQFLNKIEYMIEEIEDERKWIVNILKHKEYYEFKGKGRQFKPIKVDRFLQRLIWYQAEKYILSSATIPFRNNIERWLNRIGLGNKKYEFLSVPMTFAVENRPIITKTIGGKMTYKEEKKNWARNIEIVKKIIQQHKNERGVIHTQSYKRAEKLANDLYGFSIFLHDKDEIDGDIIEGWIDSGKQVLLSPSIKEGVDLKDDMCRFQILLKVPYPSVGDRRVKYMLNEMNQWNWYYNETGKSIVQMYGRAIRNMKDYAKFYIVDKSFNDIKRRFKFPKWFLEAIN